MRKNNTIKLVTHVEPHGSAVCSRERRIALYQRSSINQTMHCISFLKNIQKTWLGGGEGGGGGKRERERKEGRLCETTVEGQQHCAQRCSKGQNN